ncbi:MAG: phosphoribosylformylglycinamidine cyclo-ligase [Fimbriimonadales bacterium]|nr:phosphoribosylformylglycinamidine cyclo-ligase [Fimbriimonadales bacterium]MDW8052488.1 phosphoribosylformylglycinamidine cyclo-ligase [Armatimonadota bacterium]
MPEGFTYKEAGVDIDAMNRAIEQIKESVHRTFTPAVLSQLGSFGGMMALDVSGYRQPVIVASIDGVGTKVRVARMMNQYRVLGHDVVAHGVNDLLVQAARPLFFLDYLAMSKLEPQVVQEVVEGAAELCAQLGIVLLGGETAEMPDVYMPGEIDVAGCIVGIAELHQIPAPSRVEVGDAVIGIASNGLHTNGYTLARRVLFDIANMPINEYLPEVGMTLGEALLQPHRPYLNAVLPLLETDAIHGMAHITGGGFYDNIPRVLPSDMRVVIDRRSWEVPPIFTLIQRLGDIADSEMFRVFNMGIGFVLIVARERAQDVLTSLQVSGEQAWLIGEVQRGSREVQII